MFQELTGLGTLGGGSVSVPPPLPHFQVHILKYEISAAGYPACGSVWHAGVSSCLPLLGLSCTLPSVTPQCRYPSQSQQEHFSTLGRTCCIRKQQYFILHWFHQAVSSLAFSFLALI